jgi:hypothetical protein
VNRTGRLCGYLAGLAWCAAGLPAYGGAVAAALAGARPDPPWWLYHRLHLPPRARAHPVVSGGMPGWQLTLLIAAAALLAAAIAVTVSRMRARRRTAATASPARRWAGGKHPSQGSRPWTAG